MNSPKIFLKLVLTFSSFRCKITDGCFPYVFFSFSLFTSLPRLRFLCLPQAQNTQQTGFKGNLRLLVKTLEQPHLPFKILPAAVSHCLQSCGRLILAASTALLFCSSRCWVRDETTSIVHVHSLRCLLDRKVKKYSEKVRG